MVAKKFIGYVARAALRCAGTAAFLASKSALAGDSPTAIVDVQGTSYAVFAKDGAAIAVSVPVEVRLVRDARQPAPPCQEINQALASYRDVIQECKLPENVSSGTCQSVKNIIDLLRTEPGTAGASSLQQGWGVESAIPALLPTKDAVKGKIAEAADVPEPSVSVQSDVLGQGDPREVGIYVKPGGLSLASLLVGFIDVGASGMSYRPGVHRFVTSDHLLACGLLAGDVAPIWEQDAELRGTAASTAQPLTANNLYDIYTMLRASGVDTPTTGSPCDKKVGLRVGVRVGVTLRTLSLSDGDLMSKSSLVIDTLFEGDNLRLREGLTYSDVCQVLEQASPPTTITGELSWKVVGAR